MRAKVFTASPDNPLELEGKLNGWLERSPNVVIHATTSAGGGGQYQSYRFCMLIVFYTDEVTE